MPDLGAIFEPEPHDWGRRADPHVWRAMRHRLHGQEPADAAAARDMLLEAFHDLVGVSLNDDELPDQLHIAALDHGGMTGGQVHIETWRHTLLPMLLARAQTFG